MQSKLLKMMFDFERWNELMIKANEKKINLSTLKQLSIPHTRVRLYESIINYQYEIMCPHIARIPKDVPGEFREVYVNEDVDRIILTLINDCLNELFPELIHPQCKSYQKGIGCQEVVQTITKEISKLTKNRQMNFIGYKADLSKYFDSVKIEIIDDIFDTFERKLGFEIGTEPVITILRKYYHNDLIFDLDGNLVEHYGSLKQGCAVAAMLANVVLYDVDNTLSEMDIIYYRYSDDIVMIGKDVDKAKEKLEEMLKLYGLKLNPKKVESLYSDKWFKFLGFNIKGNMITLSKNRVKKFQKEIVSRTLNKPNITFEQARQNVINYLYVGDYCWGSSCLGTVNCKPDIYEMNGFIMDCLRAVKVRQNKKHKGKIGVHRVGGLGVVTNLPDRTIVRGSGRTMISYRMKTDKNIENYLTMGCLSNAYRISKPVFEACVRSM